MSGELTIEIMRDFLKFELEARRVPGLITAYQEADKRAEQINEALRETQDKLQQALADKEKAEKERAEWQARAEKAEKVLRVVGVESKDQALTIRHKASKYEEQVEVLHKISVLTDPLAQFATVLGPVEVLKERATMFEARALKAEAILAELERRGTLTEVLAWARAAVEKKFSSSGG